MSYSVIFRITSGSFANGFKIVAYIRHNRQNVIRLEGSLPPKPEIPQLYDLAFPNYREWGTRSEWGVREIEEGDGIGNIRAECLDASQKLKESFQVWMRSAGLIANLANIQDIIDDKIPSDSQPIFILEAPDLTDSDNRILQRLPWHTWNWLQETFPNAEIVLSRSAKRILFANKWLQLPKRRLRILFILGAETGIDLKPDREAVEQHIKPVAGYLEVLEKPSLHLLRKEISKGRYNGIIFSGHSDTQISNNVGELKINDHETITINEIKSYIRKAQKDGLEFFVLNSCNGFGIASESAEFVDYIVLMREKIHNQVAAIFIKHCLRYLADGFSLSSSVSKARTELQKEEDKYICASWMPTIVQNSEAPNYIPFPQNGLQKFQKRLSNILQSFTKLPVVDKFWKRIKRLPQWIQWCGYATIGLIIVGVIYSCQARIEESVGDRVLLTKDFSQYHGKSYISKKQEIADAFKNNDFKGAISLSENSKKNSSFPDGPDPEPSWTINNAKIKSRQDYPKLQAIKSIVPLPVIISNDTGSSYYSTAKESARGAVVAQYEINEQGGTPKQNLGVTLDIILDNNNPDQAGRVAEYIVKKPEFKAVIGHPETNASLSAAKIYQKNRVVMISATSTGTDLNKIGDFIFRTPPNTDLLAQSLAKHIGNKKIGFCYDSSLGAANNFRDIFVHPKKHRDGTVDFDGTVVLQNECVVNKDHQKLNYKEIIDRMEKEGATGVILYFHFNEDYQYETALGLAQEVNKRIDSDGIHKLSLYGSHSFDSPYVRNNTAFDNIEIVTPKLPSSTSDNLFIENFRNVYGDRYEPTWRDMMAYDAVKAIMYGLDQSDGTTVGLKIRMHDGYFIGEKDAQGKPKQLDGSSGPILFNKTNGDRFIQRSIEKLDCTTTKLPCKFKEFDSKSKDNLISTRFVF
jgi:branched-chain amino acid transport system substrate-binding protein